MAAFGTLQARARSAAGIPVDQAISEPARYEQYCEWLPFHHRNQVVLRRIAGALGYDPAADALLQEGCGVGRS